MFAYLAILGLAIMGVYFIGMSRVADTISLSQQHKHLASFTLGLAATLLLLIPSPDLFGPDHRFTVSMSQMLLALNVAPVFLFWGIPAVLLAPLEQRTRFGRVLSNPLITGAASLFIFLVWFIPGMFAVASSSLAAWIIKQVLFLVSGFLFWWPVIGPVRTWRPHYLIQILYLFLMRFPMSLIGFLFTFANNIVYPARSFALEICAPSSIADQQAGGLIMWIVGDMILFAAFAIVFFRGMKALDRVDSREI